MPLDQVGPYGTPIGRLVGRGGILVSPRVDFSVVIFTDADGYYRDSTYEIDNNYLHTLPNPGQTT